LFDRRFAFLEGFAANRRALVGRLSALIVFAQGTHGVLPLNCL
jgi:hypothetical protein